MRKKQHKKHPMLIKQTTNSDNLPLNSNNQHSPLDSKAAGHLEEELRSPEPPTPDSLPSNQVHQHQQYEHHQQQKQPTVNFIETESNRHHLLPQRKNILSEKLLQFLSNSTKLNTVMPLDLLVNQESTELQEYHELCIFEAGGIPNNT